MKVLLINPPWVTKTGYGLRSNTRWPHIRKDKYLQFPIYLAYAAAVLEQHNIKVKVIDAVAEEYDQQKFLERVRAEKPYACFLETSTPTIVQDLENSRLIKENTDSTVFLFGPHVTTFHEKIMSENSFIDGIIRKEFEYTIRDIALGKDFHQIAGLTLRDRNDPRRIYVNQDRPFIEGLDQLPFPAWHQFNLKNYQSHLYKSPSIMMITSRGCPFHCTYCLWPDVMYGHKQRYRSAQNIADEMGLLLGRYKIKEIRFDDDTFALNKHHVMSLCEEILSRGYNKKVKWCCFGHISQSDKHLYKKMAEAGCFRIDFGIESGSPKILHLIRKGIDIKKAKETIKICRSIGLEVYCDFMIAFPHETQEDIEAAIQTAIDLDPDYIQISYTIPYPGTTMYQEGFSQGYLLYPTEWEKYASCEPIVYTGELEPEKLDKLYYHFWKSFYLRPHYVYRTVKRTLMSPATLRKTVRGGLSFYRRFLS